ncbi:MAG TPA: hypothetical protein VJA26_12510 [Gammaproteobacteria bacterium]|nr:hypothetical protein [Gammaproteobacteria bacterium]
MDEQDRQFDQLPDEIVTRLRRSDRSQPIVDPRTDRAVLEQARAYFAARPERRSIAGRRPWAVGLAAAAMIVVALLVVRPIDQLGFFGGRDDVDGSGRVDILDAFALARLRAADADSVSAARIDALAERVVALSSSGRM